MTSGRTTSRPARRSATMASAPTRRVASSAATGPAARRRRAGACHAGATDFANVVFAGGGNRCFWQAGFWSVAAAALDLQPSRVAAVSAGAAVACALFSGSFDYGFARFKDAIAENHRNIHLRNVLDQRSIFPHGRMYRDAILACVDQKAIARLHRGPDIRLLVSQPPAWASPRLALLLGMIATGIDFCRPACVHSSVGRCIGFKPAFVPVRDCGTPEALADLILASSCAPPLIPQARCNGVAVLDGGLVGNVPTEGIAQACGETLVLLTRRYEYLPEVAGRTYVQPSQAIPVAAWDYTNHRALQATFELGRWDGEAFCSSIRARTAA